MLKLFNRAGSLIKKYPYVLWALYVPVYLAMFFGAERLILPTAPYWETSLPIDAYIPFAEIFIVPYCLWYPLLVGVGLWLIIKDGPAFRRYMWSLIFMFTFSMVFCVLVPNGQDLRPAQFERDNFFTRWVGAIYAADTNTNVFPSVHVVGTLAALFAVMDTGSFKSRWIKPMTAVLSVLIILSTVLVKQHSVLDLLAGILLGAVAYQFIYAPRFIPGVARNVVRSVKRVYYASKSPVYRQTVGAWCMFILWFLSRLTQTSD